MSTARSQMLVCWAGGGRASCGEAAACIGTYIGEGVELPLGLSVEQAAAQAITRRLPPRVVMEQDHGGPAGQRQQLTQQRLV